MRSARESSLLGGAGETRANQAICGKRAFSRKSAVYAESSDFVRNAAPIGFVERC
jgi:hypothetical protein